MISEPGMGPNPPRVRRDRTGGAGGGKGGSQPLGDPPVEFKFRHRAGRCGPRRTRFSSPGCRSCRDLEFVCIGDGAQSSTGAAGLGGVAAMGHPRRPRLAP